MIVSFSYNIRVFCGTGKLKRDGLREIFAMLFLFPGRSIRFRFVPRVGVPGVDFTGSMDRNWLR